MMLLAPFCLYIFVLFGGNILTHVYASTACDFLSNLTSSPAHLQAFIDKTFDIIIIGGGTAGVALAVRLAENSNFSIGLVEAGVFHRGDPIIEVPHFVGQGSGNPTYDWNFITTPQDFAGGRNLLLSRGKMLGGSSGLNGMAWTRASALEYDAWQRFANSPEWNWDSLLDFFKKAENITLTPVNPYPGISEKQGEEASEELKDVAGFSGPITVSYNDFYPDVVQAVVKTLNGLGLETNAQPISGKSVGITNTRYSVDRQLGVRVYSPTGYLCSSRPPDNLHILLGAQVTKLLLAEKNDNFAATGIAFSFQNKTYYINATREVILSAGAVQTPQLLELSGIGNSSILESHGVKTLIDLPGVGENFQEHLFVAVQWQLKQGHTTFDLLLNSSFEAQQEFLYNTTRGGMLAALDSLTGYFPLKLLLGEERTAEVLQAFDRDTSNVGDSSLEKLQYPIQRAWLEDSDVPYVELLQWSRGIMNVTTNKEYITMLGGIMHPASRGSSHIQSSDPLEHPNVDPRFLERDSDAFLLLHALKYILDVGKSPPLSDIIEVQTSPDPSTQTDSDLLEYIRATTAGGDHLIGTAAMGPRDNKGVVDGSLRVYGTSNVRVVDAGIIPIHIATHTQATCYAIAEKESHIRSLYL
ncbi:hypothetical protein ACEPAG_5802 [Sanghuangporus baumii]